MAPLGERGRVRIPIRLWKKSITLRLNGENDEINNFIKLNYLLNSFN